MIPSANVPKLKRTANDLDCLKIACSEINIKKTGTEINEIAAGFIQSLPFFFIATSDKEGNCDCSYRGCEFYEDGRRQPPVKAMDAKTILFPDFAGNKLFNSLGNMLVNPRIGMLFIDFENALRLRINGKVKIIEDVNLYQELWPGAQRYIKVTVDQVFGNCRKRIPKLDSE